MALLVSTQSPLNDGKWGNARTCAAVIRRDRGKILSKMKKQLHRDLGRGLLLPFLLMAIVPSSLVAMDDGELSGPYPASTQPSLPGRLIYLNGMHTPKSSAVDQARQTAVRLGCPTFLVWNDMDLSVVDDANAFLSKIVGSDAFNAAYDTLLGQIRTEIESGRQVFIVGYSAGAMITNDCVKDLNDTYDDRPDDERRQLMSRIHILLVGAPCQPSSDIPLGSVYRLFDKRDSIAQWAGEGDLGDDSADGAHSYLGNYLPSITPTMLTQSGSTVLEKKT